MPCTKQDKLFKGCWNEEGTSKEEKNPKKNKRLEIGQAGRLEVRQAGKQTGKKEENKERKKLKEGQRGEKSQKKRRGKDASRQGSKAVGGGQARKGKTNRGGMFLSSLYLTAASSSLQ